MKDFLYNFNFCPECGQKGTVKQVDDTQQTCSACQMRFWNNPKATVAVAIMRDDKVLFTRRAFDPGKDKLELPGGFLEFAEKPHDGLIREIQEELGITLFDPEIIYTTTIASMPGIASTDIVYLARKWEGEIKPNEEITDFSWESIDTLDTPEFAWDYAGLSEKLKAI